MYKGSKLLLTVTMAALLLSSAGFADSIVMNNPTLNTIVVSTSMRLNATVFNSTTNPVNGNITNGGNNGTMAFYACKNAISGSGCVLLGSNISASDYGALGVNLTFVLGIAPGTIAGFSLDGNYTINASWANTSAVAAASITNWNASNISANVALNNSVMTLSASGPNGNQNSNAVTLTVTTTEDARCTYNASGGPSPFGGTGIATFDTTGQGKIVHNSSFTGTFGTTSAINISCVSIAGVQNVSLTGDNASIVVSFTPAAPGGIVFPQYKRAGGAAPGQQIVQQSTVIGSIGQGAIGTITVTNTAIAVREIDIAVNTPVSNVQVTVKKLGAAPSTVTKTVSGTVYQYLDIDDGLTTELTSATIVFGIPKAWFTANNIGITKVALNHWTGSDWAILPTTHTGTNDTVETFSATTTSFSPFAITGQTAAAPTPVPTPTTQPTPAASTTQAGGDNTVLYLVIVAVIIIVVAFFFLRGKKQYPIRSR